LLLVLVLVWSTELDDCLAVQQVLHTWSSLIDSFWYGTGMLSTAGASVAVEGRS